MYFNRYTSATIERKTTRCITIKAGTKKGVSYPQISILIINELIEKLKNLAVGINLNNQLVSVMAFTEVLELIIEHSSHVTLAIKISESFQFKGAFCWCGETW